MCAARWANIGPHNVVYHEGVQTKNVDRRYNRVDPPVRPIWLPAGCGLAERRRLALLGRLLCNRLPGSGTIRVKRKLNSNEVIDALTDLFILRGVPAYIRSDNGPEFIAEVLRDWIKAVGAKTA